MFDVLCPIEVFFLLADPSSEACFTFVSDRVFFSSFFFLYMFVCISYRGRSRKFFGLMGFLV